MEVNGGLLVWTLLREVMVMDTWGRAFGGRWWKFRKLDGFFLQDKGRGKADESADEQHAGDYGLPLDKVNEVSETYRK